MPDSKSFFLLVIAIVFITISIALISIWGYRFYWQNNNVNREVIAPEKSDNHTKDSLQTLYNAAVHQFNETSDTALNQSDSVFNNSDSLPINLSEKLTQYHILKNEIADILKNKTSAVDLAIARQKIKELQQKVDQLSHETNEVAQENKRLSQLLKQLMNNNAHSKNHQNKTTLIAAGKPSAKKIELHGLSVYDLNLAGITIDNDKEYLTSLASKADKLEGSFYVLSHTDEITSAEIEVMVLQPNGKVLQNSAWESGVFETSSGKKIYSVKIHFDCKKGEAKRLDFSLGARQFQQGNYTMQIYHKGIMIEKMVKKLN